MSAQYPNGVKSFPALSTGDVIQDTDPEAAYDEIAAIEAALLTSGLAHHVFPDATASNRDLGTPSKQWHHGYFSGNLQVAGTFTIGGATVSGVPLGVIVPYGGASPPANWLLCDGTAISRTTYAALFAVISTTFGIGDGSLTFNLPNMQQRFPLGKAASGTGSALGSTGGAIDHTHTGAAHSHAIPSAASDNSTGFGSLPGGTLVSLDTHAHGGATGSSGTGVTGTANPPFQVVNFIILAGV